MATGITNVDSGRIVRYGSVAYLAKLTSVGNGRKADSKVSVIDNKFAEKDRANLAAHSGPVAYYEEGGETRRVANSQTQLYLGHKMGKIINPEDKFTPEYAELASAGQTLAFDFIGGKMEITFGVINKMADNIMEKAFMTSASDGVRGISSSPSLASDRFLITILAEDVDGVKYALALSNASLKLESGTEGSHKIYTVTAMALPNPACAEDSDFNLGYIVNLQ